MAGWLKLYRDLSDKPIWCNSTPEHCKILITLLMMASHEEKEWEWQGQKFKIMPGEFITSLESIRQKAGKGISIQNVRSAITRFEKLEFLTYKATKTGRLITICNWEAYQAINEDYQQSIQQRGNKEVTTIKKDKKERKNISDIFERFRSKYPGTKRGLKTELENFVKKNNPDVVTKLLPALEREIEHKEALRKTGEFVPAWKHLRTWINNRCWEQEHEKIEKHTNEQSEIPEGFGY